jgi:hypothetical protein
LLTSPDVVESEKEKRYKSAPHLTSSFTVHPSPLSPTGAGVGDNFSVENDEKLNQFVGSHCRLCKLNFESTSSSVAK